MIDWLNIEASLSKKLDHEVKFLDKISINGGDINEAYKIETTSGNFFIKYNSSSSASEMFNSEAFGLELLANNSRFKIPKPILIKENYLVLEYFKEGKKSNIFWEVFAENLAQMHKSTRDYFGLESSNYIGTLNQFNDQMDNWHEFFITQRLEPQIKQTYQARGIDSLLVRKFEKLYSKLENLFPKEPPALLHGDLWGGNYFATEKGEPAIYDPAVYFGHREMDIAMTKLFGGFGPELYSNYNTHFALENGWQERVELCNLYPLLVHLNLFGGHYKNSVEQIVNKFV